MHALSLGLCCLLILGASGCASREWVREQMNPMQQRVTEVESRLDQTEAKANHVMQEAQLALKNLENLRLEKHFVLSVQEGANFATDSSTLTVEAQRAIDEFFVGLSADSGVVFLVAGHTDATGSPEHNYVLGQRRASSVARYLVSNKGVNPVHVNVVSFGEHAPIADNTTAQGRHKNRRVEIQVYKEVIASAPGSQRLELQRMN